ncbi:RsmB/NOP family class I SAM-dependent RNA methyltransferase [Hydrogenophaga sp. 5NK40-0174]|uniref:RsmB/NOP family class I SAM-dependent RNA methyltransferase n=1 Tax=Hydrogenophaga sp. 5NK40-0174 TaxID=3127649 RepID=UPI0033420E6A
MHPKALLKEAAALLEQVLRFDHPADAVVARHFRDQKSLGPRERGVLADTVFRVLRQRTLLEWQAKAAKNPEGMDGSDCPMPRKLALLAFAGDDATLQAGVSEAEWAWLAKARALAQPESLPADRPELVHNLPAWLADALTEQLGAEGFTALAKALMDNAPLDLRVNLIKQKKREPVLAALADMGWEASPTPYAPLGIRLSKKRNVNRFPVFTEGGVEVQDEGSQLLCLLLDARRQHMVVDFCAGAGGKTLAIGGAMRDGGRLYAFDTSAHRLDALKPRLARSGLSNVHTMVLNNEHDQRLRKLEGKMDRVLVDAPCSGLGTLRRNPDLKWRQTPETVAAQAQLQTSILESAARLLKPGGRLVYATCSLLRTENEDVAEAFSAAHAKDFSAMPALEALRAAKVPTPEVLCTGGNAGHLYLRLWPHQHSTDGFFAAVWQKK